MRDLLALHGDPPLSADAPLPEGDLRHAIELVAPLEVCDNLGFEPIASAA